MRAESHANTGSVPIVIMEAVPKISVLRPSPLALLHSGNDHTARLFDVRELSNSSANGEGPSAPAAPPSGARRSYVTVVDRN